MDARAPAVWLTVTAGGTGILGPTFAPTELLNSHYLTMATYRLALKLGDVVTFRSQDTAI
jgi:hypothetical protein